MSSPGIKELGDCDYRPARAVADVEENTAGRSVIDVDILGHLSPTNRVTMWTPPRITKTS
jgi:hypothetical protein